MGRWPVAFEISIIVSSLKRPDGERIVKSDSPVNDSVNNLNPETADLFASLTEKKVATPIAIMNTKTIGSRGDWIHFLSIIVLRIFRFRFIPIRSGHHSLLWSDHKSL